MTTGSYTYGAQQSAHYETKSWNGANGKYETVGYQRIRDKWNNYTMEYRLQNISQGILGGWPNGGNRTALRSRCNSLVLEAQAKLADKVTSSAPNLVVNVAQGHQTLGMVYKALSDFGRAGLALRRGNFAKAARCLGVNPRTSKLRHTDIAGRWLELQYGWLPTLSDIYDAMQLWSSLQDPQTKVLSFYASAKDVITHNSSTSPANYSVIGPGQCRVRIQCELTEDVPLKRSLGLYDPLTLAWEVLPWSFVIDWFIPIGTYLEALNVIPKLTGRFLTTKSYKFLGHVSPKSAGFAGASGEDYGVWVERVKSSSLKVGKPRFVPLNEALSPKRMANAIALAAQVFSSPERISPKVKFQRGIHYQKKRFDWDSIQTTGVS